MELWRLIAHSHWFDMRAFGFEVRICSRCSGYVSGLIGLAALRSHVAPLFQTLQVHAQFTICTLLSIPLVADWLTQSWGLRESNNFLRFVTGLMLGVSILLYSMIGISQPLKTLLVSFFALAIALSGINGFIHRK